MKGAISFVISCLLWRLTSSELSCTLKDYKHNYIKITDPVYDTDVETIIPYTADNALMLQDVQDFVIVDANPDITGYIENGLLLLRLFQINETKEMSTEPEFRYKCTVRLQCANGETVDMYITIPMIDTNNHKPFFNKQVYTYNLISSHTEDFKRQQILNPIIAIDYDVTNTKTLFTIEDNKYFDIVYNGIVPDTLNKQHYGLVVPKVPGTLITEKLELSLTVKDVGYPSKEAHAKLFVHPPLPPVPQFDKTFYVGHYYKNDTFILNEKPRLQEGTTFYLTRVMLGTLGLTYFTARTNKPSLEM